MDAGYEVKRVKSGFWQQLLLLLWKNFTLKKRSLIVFSFEISIPLVLFLVLVFIRRSEIPQRIPIQTFSPRAMPSAGMIPVFQSFCEGHEEEVFNSTNDRLTSFLKTIQEIVQLGIFNDDVREGSLIHFPEHIHSLASRAQNALSDLPANSSHHSLKQFFTNESSVIDILQRVMKVPDNTVEELLTSSININEVLGSLSLISGDGSSEIYKRIVTLIMDRNIDPYSLQQSQEVELLVNNVCLANITPPTGVFNVSKETIIEAKELFCSLPADERVCILQGLINNTNFTFLRDQIGQQVLGLLEIGKTETNTNRFLDILKTAMFISVTFPEQQSCNNQSSLYGQTSTVQKNFTKKYEELFEFWNTMVPTLCGQQGGAGQGLNEGMFNLNSTKRDQHKYYMDKTRRERLAVLVRILYGSPKILFAPNNTAALNIIKKANETFEFYANITNYARQWQNISADVRLKTSAISGIYGVLLVQLYNSLDNIVCAWLSVFNDIDLDVFRGFSTERELETYFLNQQYHDNISVIAGLVFENLNDTQTELPPHIFYKIRQNATLTPTTKVVRNKLWYPSAGSNHQYYYYFGFVWLQDLVERAMITLQAGRDIIDPGVLLHRMPYPCFLYWHFVWNIQHIVPLCFMLSWVYPVAMLVQRIVYEKEQRLKEVMRMMGLSNGVHWCAWFITALVQMNLTVVPLTLMLHFGKILPFSNPWVIFLYLQLFAISSIAFSFLVSSCFSNAKLAAACAGIFYFLAYIPYTYISIKEDISDDGIFSAPLKTAMSLFSTTALGLGGKYFLIYELMGVGCHWDNIMVSPKEHDGFSLFLVFLMMIIDSGVYFVLAWYIEHVHPGKYGLPKPWFFLFTKSYWCYGYTEPETCSLTRLLQRRKKNRYSFLDDRSNDGNEQFCGTKSYFEEEPSSIPAGVYITELTKSYDSSKPPALNKLNLILYEGQITSFLGHNGAGKTTTMSLLTGLFPATSGNATIYGNSLTRDMDIIRQSLGICPQHNVLFDKFTVEEHLWFFAKLKGMASEQIVQETKVVLEDIALAGKHNFTPSCLSGGMQRKLSVAIAFVGGSKTVILDEPTSGVDPYSRRSIWDLLVKYKKGRTILLSTHHMDEAETLGDRIAVLSHGHLKCCGSPGFLKSNLGQGIHLFILKAVEDGTCLSSNVAKEQVNSRHILEKVQEFFSKAYIKTESKSEIHIILPLIDRQKEMCIDLFDTLDNEKDDLGIQSYGIKDSTMEEVFLKVMEEELCENNGSQTNTVGQIEDRHIELGSIGPTGILGSDGKQKTAKASAREHESQHIQQETEDIQYVVGNFSRWINQFRALIIKRFIYIKRNKKGLISQIILPALFVSIAMTVALSAPSVDDLPPLMLDLTQYYNVTQPRGNFIPFANRRKPSANYNNNLTEASASQLIETFHLPSGIGATCVLKSPFNSTFDRDAAIRLKYYPHKFELFSKYFNKGCRSVFQPGIHLDNYIPDADVIHNASWFVNTTAKDKYFPMCRCKDTGVGFICNDGGYEDPPMFKVVTHDTLQDITDSDEQAYYLNTNDAYRLHRYGGFTVGVTLPYVPDSYNTNKFTRNMMRMIAVKENVHVWFNQKGYHSMPTYANSMNNAILRANLPKNKGNPAAYGITVTNHPMKNTNNFLESDYIQGGTDVIMAIFIIIAMSFVPASFAVFLVHERKIKAKHLQLLNGMKPITYWLSNYLWDICNYLIPTVCIIAILLAFSIPTYTTPENFPAVVLLFLLYGWSITPMMYPASFIFHEPSVAYIFLIMVNLFTGITCVQSSFMFQLFSDNENISGIHQVIGNIFLIFPNYCLGNGLMKIALNYYKNEFYCHTGQYEKIVHPMIWRLTIKKLVVMAITGAIMFIFTVLCEYRFFIRKRVRKDAVMADHGDPDVNAERYRTLHGSGRQDLLRITNLSKVYRTRKLGSINAVDKLTFAIPTGECFGLLGVNGAGKTSLFKMLTGDIQATSGDAYLDTKSIFQNPSEFYTQIGYCPQFDALFDELTPTEQLQLYARLRGVTPNHEKQVVNWALQKLSLCRYRHQTTGTLSGGNKRKLSTAISLIGNPKVIFMDEPTSGMDPYSRGFLWETINNLVKEGKSILFTSHSMIECETLCSRLSIMVNGQMKCLGSIQHLKNTYGDGYTISVIMKSVRDKNSVQEFLEQKIPTCVLSDSRYKTLTFDVREIPEQLAYLFKVLEEMQTSFHVDDYSVSQNTLDNVFINFSKQQKELAKDLEETKTDSHDVSNSDIHAQGDCYDEPLILLTSTHAHSSRHTSDSGEEILVA